MKTRPLGRSGLEISEIVFGAGAVGGAVFNGPLEARSAVVRRALELGIGWIDTAPSYGMGRSEENLGRILSELDTAPSLSTKVRLGGDDLGDIPGAIARSVEASLARLRRPSLELIQLHNRVALRRRADAGVLSIEDVLGPGGVAEGFDRLRDRGLTQCAGFTALGEVDALHELVDSGRFDTAQVYHNALNPSASRPVPEGFAAFDYRGLIGAAAARGMGVLDIRVLAAGVLAGDARRAGARPISPGSPADADVARAARLERAWAGEPGTLSQQAIRFALDTEGVSGVLVGFGALEHVDNAVEATRLPPLSESARAGAAALHASDFGQLD